MLSVSCTLWSVIRIPMFLSFSFQTMCWISSTAIGSTPANGSSSMINFGSMARQRAISVRRRSPPESWSPKFLRTFCRRNSAISFQAFLSGTRAICWSAPAQKRCCLPHSSCGIQRLPAPDSRCRFVPVCKRDKR